MVENQTLKELVAPNLNQQPLCITFPTLDATTTFELKYGLIHLLPTFHGLAGEDPHKHKGVACGMHKYEAHGGD